MVNKRLYARLNQALLGHTNSCTAHLFPGSLILCP